MHAQFFEFFASGQALKLRPSVRRKIHQMQSVDSTSKGIKRCCVLAQSWKRKSHTKRIRHKENSDQFAIAADLVGLQVKARQHVQRSNKTVTHLERDKRGAQLGVLARQP